MMRIVLVGRDPLARAGLLLRLGDTPELSVARELSGVEDLGAAVVDSGSAAILWDLGPTPMPALDGLQAAAAEASAPILALVGSPPVLRPALGAGAQGALLRDAPPAQIAAALTAIQAGLQVLTREPRAAGGGAEPVVESLTPREREVLELLVEGLPNKLIADRLGISENTAKFHVNSILGKLGAESRTEAVVRAARLGWVAI
jgi:DNA-binding NarL/FixJ family response regulator